jgi:hypothetical protein
MRRTLYWASVEFRSKIRPWKEMLWQSRHSYTQLNEENNSERVPTFKIIQANLCRLDI